MLLSEVDYKKSQFKFKLWRVEFKAHKKLHILSIKIPVLRNIFFIWKIKEFKKHITNNSRIGISIIFNYKII
jgi:hypothetical protein